MRRFQMAGTYAPIDRDFLAMVQAGAVPPVPPWLINLAKRPEPKPPPESSAAGSRERAYARAALDRIAGETRGDSERAGAMARSTKPPSGSAA